MRQRKEVNRKLKEQKMESSAKKKRKFVERMERIIPEQFKTSFPPFLCIPSPLSPSIIIPDIIPSDVILKKEGTKLEKREFFEGRNVRILSATE